MVVTGRVGIACSRRSDDNDACAMPWTCFSSSVVSVMFLLWLGRPVVSILVLFHN